MSHDPPREPAPDDPGGFEPPPPPRDPDAMNRPGPVGKDATLRPAEAPGVAPPSATQPATPAAPQTGPRSTHVTCPNCGYNLTGVPIGGNCPECNLMIGRGTIHNPNLPTNGYAIASLVLGICSLVLCSAWGLPTLICAPLAIYFGGVARRQVARGGYAPSSAGLATAGRIMGWIGVSFLVLGVLVVLLVIVLPVALSALSV